MFIAIRYPTSAKDKIHWAHIKEDFSISSDETTPLDSKQRLLVMLDKNVYDESCDISEPLTTCPAGKLG